MYQLIFFATDLFLLFKIFLIYSNFSHYYNYVLELIAQQKMSLQYFEFGKLQCIEMAIWPLLEGRVVRDQYLRTGICNVLLT